jgi:phosphoglycerate dehydrogenase-like enzyme
LKLLASGLAHKPSNARMASLYASGVKRDPIRVAHALVQVHAVARDFSETEKRPAVKLGIIGAGSLGTALGERFAERGHTIMFGGGSSAQDAAVRLRAKVGSNAETAAFADVMILAVPFAAIDAALADAGPLGAACCGPASTR